MVLSLALNELSGCRADDREKEFTKREKYIRKRFLLISDIFRRNALTPQLNTCTETRNFPSHSHRAKSSTDSTKLFEGQRCRIKTHRPGLKLNHANALRQRIASVCTTKLSWLTDFFGFLSWT